jgi:methylated-DNA-[protein]-cysteine S-methyltransferase
MSYAFRTMPSPVGELTLVASGIGFAAILWENDDPGRVQLGPLVKDEEHPVLIETERQIGAYFAGRRQSFDLPLDFQRAPFQKTVWAALLTILFGETRSYAEIAHAIGHPSASYAVGAANGKNPTSIIALYHRVIGANGALTGFAGGLKAKQTLLALEGLQLAI